VDAAIEASPGVTLHLAPGAASDATPGVTVDLTPGVTVDLTPGTRPDAQSGDLPGHPQGSAAGGARRVALFAANAPVALCLARHLNARHGARWQERIALLSVDDPEWAEFAGITTIRQPTYQIGYRAVEFLHERIDGVEAAARDCLLPGELIVRASTSR
jgi:LacI family kdg operon repressor